jgi:hypothetical protein
MKAQLFCSALGIRIREYSIFRNQIFDFVREDEERVLQPFERLIVRATSWLTDHLTVYKYEGGHGYFERQAGARGYGRTRRDAMARKRATS